MNKVKSSEFLDMTLPVILNPFSSQEIVKDYSKNR